MCERRFLGHGAPDGARLYEQIRLDAERFQRVLDEDGAQLALFVPVGLSEKEKADLASVGHPRGHSLLGHLITHPEPLRVDDISAHPDSAGFPPGHPPMRTLLGAPIKIRGKIYGNLYVSERRDGRPFEPRDEAMIVTLADAAGLAVDRAHVTGAGQFHRGGHDQFQHHGRFHLAAQNSLVQLMQLVLGPRERPELLGDQLQLGAQPQPRIRRRLFPRWHDGGPALKIRFQPPPVSTVGAAGISMRAPPGAISAPRRHNGIPKSDHDDQGNGRRFRGEFR